MAWSYEILDDQDLIYQWLTRKSYPSFYSMVSNNSGALGEYFKKMDGSSLNHAMFTSYSNGLSLLYWESNLIKRHKSLLIY